jgi:hypothetical protein
MNWIPFWNNTFGRGVVLCIVSVMALSGWFLLGFVALMVSIAVMLSPICAGSFAVPPPMLKYEVLFIVDHAEQSTDARDRSVDVV